MVTLYHHPFCPHSRFIRLALGEYAIEPELLLENVWERRREFLLLSAEGATPVMTNAVAPSLSGAQVIAEYLEDTRGEDFDERRLMPGDALGRAETRRLSAWFNGKFFEEVSRPLVHEKITKRFMPSKNGGGGPDMNIVRAARSNLRYHLRYIGHLTGARKWLAGERMSYADLAAAAHLSCADYFGDVIWSEDEAAKSWYARVKSRPSFRPLLAHRLQGMAPAESYANLDF